jgi:hypothetical protein
MITSCTAELNAMRIVKNRLHVTVLDGWFSSLLPVALEKKMKCRTFLVQTSSTDLLGILCPYRTK